MGLLSWLIGPNASDTPEERLARDYTEVFKAAGMNHQEAASTGVSIVEMAKKAVVEWGWDRLPPRFGDWYLGQGQSNTEYRAALARLRSEGVRDEDIRFFLNASPLERAANIKAHESICVGMFMGCLRRGDRADVAANEVRKMQPQFGITTDGIGDDRPLPWELHRRITIFLEKHYSVPDEMCRMTEEATSFNALVRQQIRLGRL